MKNFVKYVAFARIAATEALTERAELYGRGLFIAVLLGVLSALWRAVGEAGLPIAGKHQDLVWYLAATEWVLLSAPQRHFQLQEQVRRGDVTYQLPRPVSFPRAALAQAWGMLLARAPFLALVAFGSAYAFTGTLPSARSTLLLFPIGLLASAVLSELYVALGLVAFWLSDVTPLHWLLGKSMFVLGGLMLPLELYPRWLQMLAQCTPFPAILSGPGGFMLHEPDGAAWLLIARLCLWGALLFGLVELLFQRGVRSQQLAGG